MKQAPSLVAMGVVLAMMACASSKEGKTPDSEARGTGPSVAVAEARSEAASSEEIPELPSYPGATRTKLETSTVPTSEWVRKIKVTLQVRDTFENVKAFYAKAITDYGWVVAGVTEEEDKMGWRLVKGGAVAEVRLEKEGRKRVKIKLERKDR